MLIRIRYKQFHHIHEYYSYSKLSYLELLVFNGSTENIWQLYVLLWMCSAHKSHDGFRQLDFLQNG